MMNEAGTPPVEHRFFGENCLLIVFSFANYLLLIDDNELKEMLKHVFRLKKYSGEVYDSIYHLCGDRINGYRIIKNGGKVEYCATHEQAIGVIAELLGQNIMNLVGGRICLLHAASALYNNKLITFCGTSGSGKTSMSISLAQYGEYVGDEYTFIDVDNGEVWYENFPLQVKAENYFIRSKFREEDCIKTSRADGIETFLISLDSLPYRFVSKANRVKLSVLVYPHFDKSNENVVIRQLPPGKLPNFILESLIGKSRPSELLRRFLAMAQKCGLRFLEVWFSDSDKAAGVLKEYLDLEDELL